MANSILVISFAKEHLEAEGDPVRAALEAGLTRFRPVLMTALAMIIGMVQACPWRMAWAKAATKRPARDAPVIGGLICATIATSWSSQPNSNVVPEARDSRCWRSGS